MASTGRQKPDRLARRFRYCLCATAYWLDTPEGRKKTYLFLWIDDFSRKILFGKYYFDEKLTALLDSFRYCLLRYGIPLRVYVDNGQVYVSRVNIRCTGVGALDTTGTVC